MSLNDFKEILSISAIKEKIFRITELYHPNLITNLSKQAYDLYLIRKSICDQLLKLTNEKGINLEKVKSFIKNRIKDSKKQLNKTENRLEINSIKATIEEWENFL